MISWTMDYLTGLSQYVLNISKTKELMLDFRKSGDPVTPLFILGEEVEGMSEYKYLGM